MNPLRMARILVLAAAIAWSSSTVFLRVLQQPTPLNVDEPKLSPLQIAFFRSFFAGLVLLILVRRRDMTFRPKMIAMTIAFGILTALYLSALGKGPAANAILLQNTAPVWVYFLGVYFFGDPPDRCSLHAVLLAMVGAAIIVIGNWPRNLDEREQGIQREILLMAAGSGLFYALVVLFLRQLRDESPAWLTSVNLLGGTLIIVAIAFHQQEIVTLSGWFGAPTISQYFFMALFGIVQLAVPYVLFARGLKVISPQEAGIITLIEPLLNPLWAYLIAPDRDTPTYWTLLGGAVLLAALAWRYWPRRRVIPRPLS